MKQLITISVFFFSSITFGQTWADDVASIVFEKCSKCHHPDGVAPFSLMTYQEVSSMAASIDYALNNDIMPPWPPDNNYQQYAHDRSLSTAAKTTILDWIANGTPEGNPANTPPAPVFPSGSVLGNGDLELQIPTYMSSATVGNDDYVCFALPTGLGTDRKVKAIEVVPGNRPIVHHALVYVDDSGTAVTDTVGGDCGGPGTSANLLMGYTPGSSPMVLPSVSPLKLGMTIPANSDIVLAMHYPAGSFGELDSTKVILHFYPPGETGIREVFADPVLYDYSFTLPANQVTALSAQYPPAGGLPANFSILSVFPHMHLLGDNIKSYAVNGSNDTTKFINIPDWDFEWQDFYFFKNLQKAELGATLYADAVFDNTSANPNNPNSPPQNVSFGLNTTDEMFLVYMHYMLYLPGDENYNMDSLLNLSTSSILENEMNKGVFKVYPNPFNETITITSDQFNLGDQLSISIYDQQGRLIKPISSNDIINSNNSEYTWDGTNMNGSIVSPGLYSISINLNGNHYYQRIIKR